MAPKSLPKTLRLRIEIVAKTPYAGSGPRGVDVYATNLYNELSGAHSHDKIFLTRGRVGHQSVDITHYTFFDPFFLTLWPYQGKAKYIVTVHDLIPLKFPEHFPVGIRGRIKWYFQKRALQSSAAIITDSLCSKQDITALTGISESRIHVIPLAAGHTLVTEKMVKLVRQEYKLPDRYLLYVGDINWNKNIPSLIRAFGLLDSTSTHLVLVGKAFKSSQHTPEYESIAQAINDSGKAKQIHMLGFLPSHHLASVYRGATLYVQPSWYEGFGFPILEAMEQGCPVASSNRGSLTEVGGQYAHYFDPADPKNMASLIQELLVSKVKREQYIDAGKKWARSFSWTRVVKETHAVYEQIAG